VDEYRSLIHHYGDILRCRGVPNTRILEYSNPKLYSSALRRIRKKWFEKLNLHVKLCVAEVCVCLTLQRQFSLAVLDARYIKLEICGKAQRDSARRQVRLRRQFRGLTFLS